MMDFKRQLFFDGAMGTMLQQGFSDIDTYRQYIEAGADVLTSNTFGLFDDAQIQKAINNAKTAMGNDRKFIALDIGPTGKLLEPFGDLTYDVCYDMYLRASVAGAKAGADFILVETMTGLDELKAAVSAAKTTGLPIVATMTFDESGRTMMGASLRDMVLLLESIGVDATGMNCGFGPDLYEKLLPELAALTDLPILVQPNAGLPTLVDGKPHYTMAPAEFAKAMARMSKYANLLGGCCGTTPAFIEEMVTLCRG